MKHLTILFLLAAMSPIPLFSKDTIDVGQVAPALTVTNQLGEKVDLGKLYAAGPVVVYFYPRSDTPGCTRQACNIRDNYSDLQKAGVTVVGVSMNKVQDQLAFEEKYNLPFTLIADPEKTLGKAFGVGNWMGAAYKRQTFLIIDGKVAWRDLSAKPDSQAQDVLAALKSLQAGS